LNFINSVTDEYIKSYEDNIKAEEEKQKIEEEKQKEKEKEEISKLPDFDNVIKAQDEKLSILTKDTKTIANFSIEPKYDHLYLENVYFENI
jgi:hypothetical protein